MKKKFQITIHILVVFSIYINQNSHEIKSKHIQWINKQIFHNLVSNDDEKSHTHARKR